MGIFSRGSSFSESLNYAVQAFGIGVLNLDQDVRSRVAPVSLGAIKTFLGNQSFTEEEKNAIYKMFQIISGTVGVNASSQLNTRAQAGEVIEIIESSLPFNMPIVVLGPIRMVIEEYVNGKSMDEINYEEFDKSDARKLVNALMGAIEIVNTRCIQEPKKHTKNEVLCLAFLAAVVAHHIKVQLF
jgi:hypothetical protein